MRTAPSQQNSNDILSRLSKVRRLGDGKYVACCPVHGDKNPSLAVTQKPDGATLIHCFGCGANGIAVCNALGVDPSVLFPPSDNPKYEKQSRSGFNAWQLLHGLKDDLIRLVIVANELKKLDALSDEDRSFVANLAIRISDAINYLEGAQS